MQTATSETEVKSLDLSICVYNYTLRAPCSTPPTPPRPKCGGGRRGSCPARRPK